MSILNVEKLLESGKLFKKISKAEVWTRELNSMSELSGFVYIRSHVILHVKFKAQKVN